MKTIFVSNDEAQVETSCGISSPKTRGRASIHSCPRTPSFLIAPSFIVPAYAYGFAFEVDGDTVIATNDLLPFPMRFTESDFRVWFRSLLETELRKKEAAA